MRRAITGLAVLGVIGHGAPAFADPDTTPPALVTTLSAVAFGSLAYTLSDLPPGSGPKGLHSIVTTGSTTAPDHFISGASGMLLLNTTFSSLDAWGEDMAGNMSAHSVVINATPVNAGFEQGVDSNGHAIAWNTGFPTLVDCGPDGKAAELSGLNYGPGTYIDAASRSFLSLPLSSSAQLVVSVAARADAALACGGCLADIEVNAYQSDGRTMVAGYAFDVRGSATQMKVIAFQRAIPSTARQIGIRLRVRGPGTVDFDDLRVWVMN